MSLATFLWSLLDPAYCILASPSMGCFSHNQPFPIAFFSLYTSPLVRLFVYLQESMRCSLWEQTLFMLPVGGPSDSAHTYLKWICIPASQWILCKNCSWKRPDEEIYKCDHKSPPWNPFQPNLLHLCSDVLPCLCNHFCYHLIAVCIQWERFILFWTSKSNFYEFDFPSFSTVLTLQGHSLGSVR